MMIIGDERAEDLCESVVEIERFLETVPMVHYVDESLLGELDDK